MQWDYVPCQEISGGLEWILPSAHFIENHSKWKNVCAISNSWIKIRSCGAYLPVLPPVSAWLPEVLSCLTHPKFPSTLFPSFLRKMFSGFISPLMILCSFRNRELYASAQSSWQLFVHQFGLCRVIAACLPCFCTQQLWWSCFHNRKNRSSLLCWNELIF